MPPLKLSSMICALMVVASSAVKAPLFRSELNSFQLFDGRHSQLQLTCGMVPVAYSALMPAARMTFAHFSV